MTCKQCGKCCRMIYFKISKNPMEIAFYKTRGFEVVTLHKSRTNYVKLQSKCPHLTEDNKCDIYTNRPMACRTFGMNESSQPYLPEGCGYKKTR